MGQLTPEARTTREWIQSNPTAYYGHYLQAHPGTAFTADQFNRHKYEALKRRPNLFAGHGAGVAADFETDKKIGALDWEELCDWMIEGQKLKKKASYSQDYATIDFSHLDRPICVVPISDTHIGSWATDYEQLKRITKEIKETPDLYVCFVGDMVQASIKLRSVLEVSDNLLPPGMQDQFFEKWLEYLEEKVLFGTWDNHPIMRQEQAIGYSPHARIMSRRVIYFDHIGHADIKVGEQVYKVAVSHKFRGTSIHNRTHAQQRYMRMEGTDREIGIMGDIHTVACSWYYDGPVERLAITCGTIQTDSGYGKRHFSLFTSPSYPCFTLDPKEHHFDAYKTVGRWLKAKQSRE